MVIDVGFRFLKTVGGSKARKRKKDTKAKRPRNETVRSYFGCFSSSIETEMIVIVGEFNFFSQYNFYLILEFQVAYSKICQRDTNN